MDANDLTQRLTAAAHELGFDYCRIVPVTAAPHARFFDGWLAAGHHAAMGYMARNVDKRRDPARLAEGDAGPFRSLIVLGVDYYQFAIPPEIAADPSRGLIASYAWGDDYHEIIRPRLYELDAALRRWSGRTTQGKCLVDSGPVLERDWAHSAGLGFMGKHGCIIHPVTGSWLLLATILVPETLVYDPPRPTTDDPAPRARVGRAAPRGRLWALADCARRRRHRDRHMRALHPLPGCLPDRRLCRPLSPGRGQVHQLLDHRDARADPARTARGLWQPHLWLRHLPGGLPVESAIGRPRRR